MTMPAPTPEPPPSKGGGRVIGAILTGGESSRMGAPKHALRLSDGRMMIEHMHEPLSRVCDEVVTVGGAAVLPGVRHIRDVASGLGPIGGLEALTADAPTRMFLVVPCDMPLLTQEILRAMLIETHRPISAIRVAGEERVRSLPLRFRGSILPVLRARIQRGLLALYGLLDEFEIEVVEGPAEWEPLLANINTLEEFDSLSRSSHQRPTD